MENQTAHSAHGAGNGYNRNQSPRNLPNAGTILLLGILSILLCWWHFLSIAGIILGILALVMANRETAAYYANPGQYSISSLNQVKTGRICALIGLTISVVIFFFVLLLVFGILATLPFWGMIH